MRALREARPLVVRRGLFGGWRHPWLVSPRWDGVAGQWAAEVQPGFVNGDEVEFDINPANAPSVTLERLGGASTSQDTKPVSSWLSESPLIPLTGWRGIGSDSQPTSINQTDTGYATSHEPVPPFFAAMGVTSATPITVDLLGDLEVSGFDAVDTQPPRLRAVDIVLIKDRTQTGTSWVSGSGTDGTFAQFQVTYSKRGNYRDRARLVVNPRYVKPTETDPITKLQGGWNDDSQDSLLIATAYLVSPPGLPPGSLPDETWQAFVAHRQFFNLNYATNSPEVFTAAPFLSFPFPLAGGAGTVAIQAILAIINDNAAAMNEFTEAATIRGRFWST